MILDTLEARRVESGHWPCLLDLRDALVDRKEDRSSDELRFRNRCLARVDALCRVLGDKTVGVEQGIDLEYLIKAGNLLVLRMELEKSIQDFLTNWLLMYAFELRTLKKEHLVQSYTGIHNHHVNTEPVWSRRMLTE
ncbi:hypothetical protein ACFL02_03835 [Planctomycetota bacterium]